MKLSIHPEASLDIREEATYYEQIRPGLGLAFMDEVDAAIDSALSMPKAFPARRKNIRMIVLARFPFSVLYRASESALEITTVW